ncbi:ABC transporter substrate-binding protein, partial [Pseudomonas graminis]
MRERAPTLRLLDPRPRSWTQPTAILGVATLCSLMLGCGQSTSTVTRSEQPVKGGTLVYATDREPTCLDPHVAGDMP